jgi:hypothetical protein
LTSAEFGAAFCTGQNASLKLFGAFANRPRSINDSARPSRRSRKAGISAFDARFPNSRSTYRGRNCSKVACACLKLLQSFGMAVAPSWQLPLRGPPVTLKSDRGHILGQWCHGAPHFNLKRANGPNPTKEEGYVILIQVNHYICPAATRAAPMPTRRLAPMSGLRRVGTIRPPPQAPISNCRARDLLQGFTGAVLSLGDSSPSKGPQTPARTRWKQFTNVSASNGLRNKQVAPLDIAFPRCLVQHGR